MQDLHIYPGALVCEAREDILYRQIRTEYWPALPKKADLGEIPLIIRHQHKLPVCTGEAGAYLRSVVQYQKNRQLLNFSGMFIYKMNRLYYDGLKPQTIGSTLKATMRTLQARGVCLEESYRSNYRTLAHSFPSLKGYGAYLFHEAEKYRLQGFARLETLEDIMSALADDLPVIFSLIIFTDFYEAENGVVSRQIRGRKIGGHSMVALGYDTDTELVRVVQSWGKGGQSPTAEGYMYIPFSWFKETLNDGTPLLLEAYVPL